MSNTQNHGYNVPSKGDQDWHNPLNENFENFDTDIEVRDVDANKGNYQPASGAKFLATDTGIVYRGDGNNWVAKFVFPSYNESAVDSVTVTVDGTRALELTAEGGNTAGNVLAGHSSNNIGSGVVGATISGGGYDDGNIVSPNSITTNYGSIGGGFGNTTDGDAATVGGGRDNEAGAAHATVPGGINNQATGKNSFAAGSDARASNNGAFVWADSNGTLTSLAADEFVARASGGFYLYSDSAVSTGVELPSGAGSWQSVSSRTVKSNVVSVNGPDVLDNVADLDIATWNYDAEDETIRHMGPMAEDFHDVFGLGRDEQHISNVDADGVALAAIQGLSEKLDERTERIEEQRDHINTLEAENEELRSENKELRDRLAAVEGRLDSLEANQAGQISADPGEEIESKG